MKNKILNFVILIILNLINPVHAFVTVGDIKDSDCDYSDLQSAIDSEELEIRASNQSPFIGNFLIENQSINLIGGYDNCQDASQNTITTGNKSNIQSDTSGHLLKIDGQFLSHTIQLSGFDINNSIDGSGLYIIDVDGLIEISNSNVQSNQSTEGAGLYVRGTNLELVVVNSNISNNQASSKGGGIYCEAATIKIDATSLISDNKVNGSNSSNTGLGGGLYGYQCNIEIYAGHRDGVSAGFIGNQSTRDGAGLYANSSQLLLNGQQESLDNPILGDYSHPVLFKGNMSDSDDDGTGYGAAIMLRSTDATIHAAWFDGNTGSPNGNGDFSAGSVIHSRTNSSVMMSKNESQPCWREGLCNLVTNNKHIAISHTRSHSMVIKYTEFSHNTFDSSAMIFFNAFSEIDNSTESTFTFESNLVHNNASGNVGLFKSNSRSSNNNCCSMEVNIFNNTITNNQFTDEIFDINDDTIFNMHGNIVFEETRQNPVVDIYNSAFTDADITCLIAHEILSLPNITINTFVSDPLFVDADNGDYHLIETSPAIDYCDTSKYTPTTFDIDQQIRGVDHEVTTDFEGFIDLGVDEYYPSNTIFENGFESIQ